jgi:septum formation protein
VTPISHFESAPKLVLASASPRRRELLGALGISYRVVAADIDERLLPDEAPDALVRRLAETKALAVAGRLGHEERSQVLAADTEVAWQGSVLGKPADPEHARTMLLALRARPHTVLTGLALARGESVVWSRVVETAVWMRAYADDEIERYIASGRPLDKAGAYGIQDAAFHPVERIEGCYTNVVGLPLCEVSRALRGVAADDLCARMRVAAGVPGVQSRCVD